MSGVGEAAAILQLVQLSAQVINGCYNYLQSARNAPAEITRTVSEVNSLKGILEHLQRLASEGSGLAALGSLMGPQGPFEASTAALEELAKKLKTLNEASAVRRRLLWPIESGKFEEILQGLEKRKTTFILALAGDNAGSAQKTELGVQEVKTSMEELQAKEKRRSVLRWLKDADPTSNHRAARKKHEQPETGTWLLNCEDFGRWTDREGQILWMHGIPGAGKTVLSSIVIEHLVSLCAVQPGSRVAYFYFDFSDKAKQNTFGCLKSIAYQLCEQSEELHEDIVALYDDYSRSPTGLTTEVLVDISALLLSSSSKSYLVIDALDECSEQERDSFLTSLQEIKSAASGNYNIFITSRPEADIQRKMDELHPVEVVIKQGLVDEDIRAHVRACLVKDVKLSRWPEAVKTEIEDRLTNGANGMFRWAVCQLVALRKCFKVTKVKEALNSLPETLDETYERIFRDVPPGYEREIRAILMLLAFSMRPMSIEEVAEATAVNLDSRKLDPEDRFPDPYIVLELCSSLVAVTTQKQNTYGYSYMGMPDEIKILQFSHFSVKEYLLSDRARSKLQPEFCISRPISQQNVTQMCLLYLLDFNGGERANSFNHAEFPFLQYAAKYWTEHWSEVEKADQGSIESLFSRLFDPEEMSSFMNWLNLWDPVAYKKMPSNHQPFGVTGWHGSAPVWAKTSNKEDFAPPLYYACLFGLLNIAMWLARPQSRGMPSQDDLGQALEGAAQGGHSDIVRFLLDQGADPNSTYGQYFSSPLHAAASCGDTTSLTLLANAGADVNADRGGYIHASDGKWGTPLHVAVISGHVPAVEVLLSLGADINAYTQLHGTPLCRAAANGEDALIALLLKRGADPMIVGGSYYSPLEAACEHASVESVRLLLDNGADVNKHPPGVKSPLYVAALRGDLDIMRLLLNRGADVNARGGTYGSPLQASIHSRNEASFDLILENGGDIDYQGGYCGSPVGQAVFSHMLSILGRLLKLGAKFGEGTLAEAIDMRLADVAEILLDRGADPNTEHIRYGNMLQFAVHQNEKDIVRRLVEKGADLNIIEGEHGTALQAAVLDGDEEIVRLLLDAGADVSLPSHGEYGSALQAAVVSQSGSIINLLLENGSDVNANGGRYGTAIQAAARNGDRDLVQLLLERGAEVNAKGGWYGTALRAALAEGHRGLVKLLLDHGADPCIEVTGNHTSRVRGSLFEDFHSALEVAAASGDTSLVQMLLDHGVDINEEPCGDSAPSLLGQAAKAVDTTMMKFLLSKGADPRKDSGYALSVARSQRNLEMIQLLLEHGADINKIFGWHGSALQSAINNGDYDIARFLLDAGADVNIQAGFYGSPLQDAILREGISGFPVELIERGADVNLVGGEWCTPLMAAAKKGDEEILHALLDRGADVNGKGGNALQAAIWGKYYSIANELLDRGADVNAPGMDASSLITASGYGKAGQLDLVKRLLSLGANIETKDDRSGSALQKAAYAGNDPVVRFLIEQGADVNSSGGEYGNPLQTAASYSNANVVKLLLASGAHVNAVGGKDGTALQAAAVKGNRSIINLLLEAGADVNLEGGYCGTPLQATARGGSIKRMEIFLEHGANVNTNAGRFGGPLQAAAKRQEVETVAFLLKRGAKVNLCGGKYGTAIQAAASGNASKREGQEAVKTLQLLIEKGADVNATGGKYGTALQAAAYHSAKYVRLLLQHGADMNIQGGKFGSPLKAAQAKGLNRVVKMLREHGAKE
ncbi:MAG: hypothetical protein M1839_006224 [Geoglossum umbratile]|nr:MAG: hypothetical protein M1839_006224 [Geoglossum umbratile]